MDADPAAARRPRLCGRVLDGRDPLDYAVVWGLGALAAWLAWRWSPTLLHTNARVVRWLLAPSERTRLERRVEHLAESRADSVDAQALELRRIERDLHAGRPWPDRRGPRIRAGPAAPGRRGRHADRVFDVDQFIDAVRRVAGGGTVMDPEVVAQLLSRRQRDEPLAELTPREREVLGLMAEGRSNAASVDGCSSPTRPSASTSTASSASSACPLR